VSELNDPRVLFAAERTLLAWTRTSLALMGFGFLIERIGLFGDWVAGADLAARSRLSFWLGIAFILVGAIGSLAAGVQFRRVAGSLRAVEIPEGYRVNSGLFVNLSVTVLGVILVIHLIAGSA
jgi:putative membrane protein